MRRKHFHRSPSAGPCARGGPMRKAIRGVCMFILAAAVGAIVDKFPFWPCAIMLAISAVGAAVTFESVGRFFGWRPAYRAPGLHVAFDRSDMTETLTFS